jgi:hypothetical protein
VRRFCGSKTWHSNDSKVKRRGQLSEDGPISFQKACSSYANLLKTERAQFEYFCARPVMIILTGPGCPMNAAAPSPFILPRQDDKQQKNRSHNQKGDAP